MYVCMHVCLLAYVHACVCRHASAHARIHPKQHLFTKCWTQSFFSKIYCKLILIHTVSKMNTFMWMHRVAQPINWQTSFSCYNTVKIKTTVVHW